MGGIATTIAIVTVLLLVNARVMRGCHKGL
jgi:hypothetical protein